MKASPTSSPSTGLMQFAKILSGKLVLDAPCGFGRNTIALAQYGCRLLAADQDQRRLDLTSAAAKETNLGGINLVRCDLTERGWCFGTEVFDAVICVHFDFRPILGRLLGALRRGGYAYLETFGGYGCNYLELPAAGYLKERLANSFEISTYIERKVRSQTIDAVTVRTFFRKLP